MARSRDIARRGADPTEVCLTVNYLSDANLRTVLTVLVAQAGGEVHITNAELLRG